MSTLRCHPASWLRDLSVFTDFQPKLGEELLWYPKVDIKEEADQFVIYADLPGVDPAEIEIEAEGDTLTLKGQRKTEKEEKDEKFYRIERSEGKFKRQFTLPETINSEKITANVKNGVLAIHLPKAKEAKTQRKINVVQLE